MTKELLDKVKAALEFYADSNSWTIEETYDGSLIDGVIQSEDVYLNDAANHSHWGVGGKRAREALETIKEWEESMPDESAYVREQLKKPRIQVVEYYE